MHSSQLLLVSFPDWEHFLQLLKAIVSKGLKYDYIQKNENIKKVKGKINISKHIQKNICNKQYDKVYCKYMERSVDIPENRLLKKTLLFCQQFILQMKGNESFKPIYQTISYCLGHFENVDSEIKKKENNNFQGVENNLELINELNSNANINENNEMDENLNNDVNNNNININEANYINNNIEDNIPENNIENNNIENNANENIGIGNIGESNNKENNNKALDENNLIVDNGGENNGGYEYIWRYKVFNIFFCEKRELIFKSNLYL